MLKKAAGILLLTSFGSLIGILIYTSFFEERKVYVQRDYFQPVFSSYAGDAKGAESDMFPSFVNSVKQARPAVVHIRARYDSQRKNPHGDFFSNPFRKYFDEEGYEPPQGMASGSGVLISPQGYIATNNHVIEDADEVEVTLFDNRSYPAKVIGTDVTTDLALLKIEGDELPFLRFGDSDQVQVGQWVIAVGNPMDLNSTVTAGIVSAKGRNLNLLRPDSEFAIESFIQTDAAVNKGNSGGALVNQNGELVGINTAIASRTGYYAGYSFAIPTSIVKKVMEDFLNYGEVKRGFLGVSIQPVNAFLAEKYKLHVLKGAYVTDTNVKLGAADAGIRPGDVIVSVNDIVVNNSSELQEQVSRYRPGERIRVKLFRGKDELEVLVTLKTLDGDLPDTDLPVHTFEYKGSQYRSLTDDEMDEYEIKNGVLLEQASRAMEAHGIESGFIITSINGTKIRTIDELQQMLIMSGESINIGGVYQNGEPATYQFRW